MNKEQELKERKRVEKIKLNILIVLFSIISFYTSYTGFLKLTGVIEHDYLLMGVMGLLVGALQYALVFSINAFHLGDLFRKNRIKAVALLAIYMITMVTSVTFSFSYWYQEFSAEGHAQRSSELQLNGVKDSLITAQDSFSRMGTKLKKLSDYSTTESNRERIDGKTCDRTVGSGEGPFTWLRADDARLTKSYLDDVERLEAQLNQDILQVANYIESFDPNGDVIGFNRTVNDSIKQINLKYFKNQTLSDLKNMLISRSGLNRKAITVTSKKTGQVSTESCMDNDFSFGAKKVIARIDALSPIEELHFFDRSNTKELFARTTAVLMALMNPSTIKSVDEMTHYDDITSGDLYAVSAGFIIDLLILLVTLYAKEPKEHNLVLFRIVKKILNGEYSNEIMQKLKPYLAEMNGNYLVALPKDVDDQEIENIKQLILYMQHQKLATLFVNKVKGEALDEYFPIELRESYPDKSFRVYQVPRKKFEAFILQNIEQGEENV
ncbi:hypothetical protein GSY74_01710 [Sulfurovum sp. bin170]|uniref:hypothetical protein n=1 Tax=Sulfurovum sp. bin170 TaxID=2695268 RepID=UPI0013E0AA44|nr:hypothetical protein [Sulfurovum sp. bin170]NEW59987.1 hypothetical protein [Sulfurovum sp. bin170]